MNSNTLIVRPEPGMSHARSPYREVLETYLRRELVAPMLVVGMMDLFLLILGAASENGRDSAGVALMSVAQSGFMGMLLNGHLTEMLGSPRSRVTPGLHRAHLLVAGAIVVVFAVLIPLATSLSILGLESPNLAIVAIACVTCSAPALLDVLPFTQALSWLLFGWIFFLGGSGWIANRWPPSTTDSLLLLGFSVICMAVLAVRYSRFHEEMRGYANRKWTKPISGSRETNGDDMFEGSRSWEALRVPVPRNLRSFGGQSPGPGEGLWRRARHWNAVWRVVWTSILIGVLLGGLPLALDFQSPGALSRGVFAISFLFGVPLLGLRRPGSVFQPLDRILLANEFLRPFSRVQHVRAVGLVLVGSAVGGVLLAAMIPMFGLWFLTGRSAVNAETVWTILAGTAWFPVLFGVGVANLKPEESIAVIALCLSCYVLFALLLGFCGDRLMGIPLGIMCAAIAAFGVALTRAAYRLWLNRDVG
jgi:hypothetical protein